MKEYAVIVRTYKFMELDKEVQERLIEAERASPEPFFAMEEHNASLYGFCDHFGLTGVDFSVSAWSHSWCRASANGPSTMKGVRLWKWLKNGVLLDNDLLSGNCPFTGVCHDENLLGPIRKFLEAPCMETTYQGLVDECLESWVRGYCVDEEYASSDKCITEFFLSNEREYLGGGDIYEHGVI